MTPPKNKHSFWFYLAVFYSFVSAMAGFTGLVDGLVEWRDSFKPIIELYMHIRATILDLIPVSFPKWQFDWFVIGSASITSFKLGYWQVFNRELNVPTEHLRPIDRLNLSLIMTVQGIVLWPMTIITSLGEWLTLPPYLVDERRAINRFFKFFFTLIAMLVCLLLLAVDFKRTF